MKPLMEYENYRLYVRDYYAERKDRSGFTWRDFAKESGYASPVFLKLVCDGKANLSEVGMERVASAMGLVGADLEYFRSLVRFNQEKDSSKKKNLFVELRKIASENSTSIVGEAQYDYYESWVNSVVREIAPRLASATPGEISNKFVFDTPSSEIRKSLAVLQKVGLLEKKEDGTFRQAAKSISTGNLDIASISIREMHRQMGELAVRALDEIPVKDRDISGMTVGVSENAFYRITKEIETFRQRVRSIVLEDSNETRVCRLNIQFFPLTKDLKEGEDA